MDSEDSRGATGRKGGTRRVNINRRTSNTGDRLVPYLVPVALCLSALPVSLIGHWQWGDNPLMVSLMSLASAGLSLFTYVTWGIRRRTTRTTAAVFVLAVSLWITFAVATNPLSRPMLNSWIFGTVVFSAAWGLRHGAMSRHHDEDIADGQRDTFLERLGGLFDRLNAKKIEDHGNRITAEYAIPPGEGTVDDIQAELKRVAGALEVPVSAVTITETKPNHVLFSVQPGDPLGAGPVFWPGPFAPGRSVADAPLRFGWRMNDTPVGLWVCGDERLDRQLSHMLDVGMTGAGKSETLSTIMIEGRSRIDFVPVVADPRKFDQAYGDIADTFALSAADEEQTLRLISNFPATAAYRAKLLGNLIRSDGGRGYKQWEPECWTLHKIPLVFLVVDEAASVISGNEDFNDGVRLFRSTGIFLVAGLQTAIGSDIDRKIRDQFGQALAHGCKSSLDSGFVLTDETLAAGADPTKWQANKAGALFAELTGTPKDQWHLECRAFLTDHPDDRNVKRRALEASRPTWASLDAGTAFHLGQGITVPDVALPIQGSFTPVQGAHTPVTMTKTAVLEDRVSSEYTPDLDPEDSDVDVTQSIPRNPALTSETFETDRPTEEWGQADAEEEFDLSLEQMIGEGVATVRLADFSDVIDRVGRSRGWGYNQLDRLERLGRIKADPKGSRVYRVVTARQPGLNGVPVGQG